MAFLIDADVIIQAERKALDLDAWLRAHPDEEIKIGGHYGGGTVAQRRARDGNASRATAEISAKGAAGF